MHHSLIVAEPSKRSLVAKWSTQKSNSSQLGSGSTVPLGWRSKSPSRLQKSGLNESKSSKMKLRNYDKSVPSTFLGNMKSKLEVDTKKYNLKLAALVPTVKSLALKVPDRIPPPPPPYSAKKEIFSSSHKQSTNMDYTLASPHQNGEKLVTVGGYIISLLPSKDDITSVIKPKIHSGSDGLEVEIKIHGCHPTEIRFEKRYNTLIVIGVVRTPIPKSPLGLKSTYKGEGVASHRQEFLKAQGFLVSPAYSKFQSGTSSATVQQSFDSPNEMQEIVNIFVPKNTFLNQVFVSKPDAKGRIFVKGP